MGPDRARNDDGEEERRDDTCNTIQNNHSWDARSAATGMHVLTWNAHTSIRAVRRPTGIPGGGRRPGHREGHVGLDTRRTVPRR